MIQMLARVTKAAKGCMLSVVHSMAVRPSWPGLADPGLLLFTGLTYPQLCLHVMIEGWCTAVELQLAGQVELLRYAPLFWWQKVVVLWQQHIL